MLDRLGPPLYSRRSALAPLAFASALLCAALAGCGGQAELDSAAGPGDFASADLAAGKLPGAPRATVVLVHGMGGFKKVAGIDYFYQVPGDWRAAGASVFIPATTAVGSVEQRAAELKAQLDKVPGQLILVAHSQGGLDARWLISKLGYADRVVALLTIATPHHGTPLADLLLGECGQPLAFTPGFDHRAFYRGLLQRMHDAGW